jgi:hypothetical protein
MLWVQGISSLQMYVHCQACLSCAELRSVQSSKSELRPCKGYVQGDVQKEQKAAECEPCGAKSLHIQTNSKSASFWKEERKFSVAGLKTVMLSVLSKVAADVEALTAAAMYGT